MHSEVMYTCVQFALFLKFLQTAYSGPFVCFGNTLEKKSSLAVTTTNNIKDKRTPVSSKWSNIYNKLCYP